MRKLLIPTLLPALLATAVLAACGGGLGGAGRTPTPATDERTTASAQATEPAADEPGPAGGPARSTSSAPAEADPATSTTAPPAPAAEPEGDGRRYACPEGGIDAVRALQQAVDQGHQPWRLSPQDVAAACTFGLTAATVEPAGPDRYRVTETATGDAVVVTLARPLGPGTIWAVTQ